MEFKTLIDLLRTGADKYPDQPALFFESTITTYSELYQESLKAAAGLKNSGILPGDRVGILLQNNPEYITSFFGIAAMGAVAVPINTMLKPSELQFILKHSGAKALISGKYFKKTISETRRNLSDLQTVWMLDAQVEGCLVREDLFLDSAEDTKQETTPEDLVAILYTSGTTGRPKGTVLTHNNYIANTLQVVETIDITKDDRSLCVLPLFHVNAQVISILAPLAAGGSVVLCRAFSPRDFFEQLADKKPTIFSAVPTIYEILNTLPEDPSHKLDCLRLVISGAAPLSESTMEAFEKRYEVTILEGYGLTEATCACTVNRPGNRVVGSVGSVLSGQEIRIAGKDGGRLSRGQVGEVYISGENVMKCYHKDKLATDEAMHNHWLKTGDLGYRDEDGNLFLVGRVKDMIIRGGENIYPREVEETLEEHPSVAEAAVCGVPDRIWGEEVIAFVITEKDSDITVEEIKSHCKNHLADYKCPSRIEFWETLPHGPNGEIQKQPILEQFRQRTEN